MMFSESHKIQSETLPKIDEGLSLSNLIDPVQCFQYVVDRVMDFARHQKTRTADSSI